MNKVRAVRVATEPVTELPDRDVPEPERNRAPRAGTEPEPGRTGTGNSGKKSVYPSRTGNGPVTDRTGPDRKPGPTVINYIFLLKLKN